MSGNQSSFPAKHILIHKSESRGICSKITPSLPREGGSRLVRRSSKSEGGSETEGFLPNLEQLFESVSSNYSENPSVPADGATSP